MLENVVLVNEKDEPIGLMEKLQAHKEGLLHRAISVMIFNNKNEILIQQRSKYKYHSPLIWANACCSHPREHESVANAAKRRLLEEMGIECKLEKAFDFVYKTDVGDGLIEHELDHVFFGHFDGNLTPNTLEVASFNWIKQEDLEHELKTQPEKYAVWFHHIFKKFLDYKLCPK